MSVDDVPADFVQKEKEIEMGKEDLANKPEQIRAKIVDGRITKRLAELALLEQAYIRDESGKVPVKDHVKETTAKLGEKISVSALGQLELRSLDVMSVSSLFRCKLAWSQADAVERHSF